MNDHIPPEHFVTPDHQRAILEQARSVLRRTAQYDDRGQWPSDYQWDVRVVKMKPVATEFSPVWEKVAVVLFAVMGVAMVVSVVWFGLSWWTAPLLVISGWVLRSLFVKDAD